MYTDRLLDILEGTWLRELVSWSWALAMGQSTAGW